MNICEIILSGVVGLLSALGIWILTYKLLIAKIIFSKVIIKDEEGYGFRIDSNRGSICDIELSCSIRIRGLDPKKPEGASFTLIQYTSKRPIKKAKKVPIHINEEFLEKIFKKLTNEQSKQSLQKKFNNNQLNIEDIINITDKKNEINVQVSAYHQTTGLKRYSLKTYTKECIINNEGEKKFQFVPYSVKYTEKKQDNTPSIEDESVQK